MSSFLARLDEGIGSDENVVFYPSVAKNPDDGSDCKIEVRGRISEERHLQEVTTIALTLAGVPHAKGLAEFLGQLTNEEESVRLFKERVQQFVLDGESNEQFDIAIAGTSVKNHASDLQGFFGFLKPWLTVPAASIKAQTQGNRNPWLSYTATSHNRKRSFEGRSLLLGRHGVIVVSDIDDTIKASNVPEPRELIINTLFRPFRHTPGLPETYKAWAENDADFIYLTNSPYQLYEPLTKYLQGEGHYPAGAYYMRLVGLDDVKRNIAERLAIDARVGTRENPKKHNLIPILQALPERKFVFIGDSTELDAEIYVDLYQGKNFPIRFNAPTNGYADRIEKIYIRDVKNSKKREEAKNALDRINDSNIARFFDADRPDILEETLPLFRGH
jgi:Phosphatidate phosphatase APP1, catalytic domain